MFINRYEKNIEIRYIFFFLKGVLHNNRDTLITINV